MLSTNEKVVMGLSGGMDSTTLLAYLLRQGYEVDACVFYYGSKHNKYENQAAFDVVDFYNQHGFKVRLHFIDVSNTIKDFKSSLLLSGSEIPEGHYESETMKSTVVPGRNLIFSSIMAGLAESIGASKIALGVHSGDHHIYPDCRVEFIKALDTTIYLSSDRKVSIITPFAEFDKAKILQYGYTLGSHGHYNVPYDLTRTCYKDQVLSCGKCGSCVERLEAFQKIGIIDPIEYEK